MTIIQLGRAYPLKARELTTKKDKNGRTYKFHSSHFALTSRTTVRVYGRDEDGAWASLDFKTKHAPKWLRRGIQDVEKMQAKAS